MQYKVRLSDPCLLGNELKYLTQCVKDNWISSAGSFVTEFENKIAKFFKRKFAISTSSGTSAIELSLRAAGVERDSIVLVPDWTFSGTINAVINIGAIPILCDIDLDSYGISENSVIQNIETQKKIGRYVKAIVTVHPLGLPFDGAGIKRIASQNNIKIVEDAAGAFNSKLNGELVGSTGELVTFSFNGNKLITTGGGGIILTDNEVFFHKLQLLRSNSAGIYEYKIPSYNHQMLNTSAAIGLAQLEMLHEMTFVRTKIHNRYDSELLHDHDLFKIEDREIKSGSNYWLYWLLFSENAKAQEFVGFMETENVQVRQFWNSLSLSPAFSSFKNEHLQSSQTLSGKIVVIPCSASMSDDDQSTVINSINKWVSINR